MKRNICLLLCAGATLSCLAQNTAGRPDGWTLRQCIDYAIAHNITVQQSKNTAEQSAVEVSTAKWSRLPTLNGSASQNWSWGRAQTAVKDEDGKERSVFVNTSSHGTNFSLSTSIPVFTGMQIPNQYALAKLNWKAALADLEKAKEDIAVQVTSYYLQVLLNTELARVAQDQTILSQEQLKRLQRLYEVGKASQSEVAEAQARVAQDQMSAVQADNNYRLALLDLSQLLELPTPDNFETVRPDTAFTPETLTPPDEIYQYAVVNKPEVQAARYRLEGSDKSIKIAQSAYYPQISFGANLGTNYYSTIDRNFSAQMKDNFGKNIGFSLSVPLFNRLSTRNRVRSARLQKLNQQLQLDNVKKQLYKEIQQAWYTALASESKYGSSLAAVEANRASFKLMAEKYTGGKATAVEYNEARLNLTKALSDCIQAKYDYMFRTKILDFYKGEIIE